MNIEIPDEFAGGTVFVRGGPGYDDHAYQYATTSFENGTMQPALIFYPKDDDDIIKAIRYAQEKNIAIALRTGGHQYCGASSTSGDNIQLDLSRTYKDFEWDDATGLLRVGVSYSLTDFNAAVGARGLFVPHGECSNVHLGGHMQSGGFGMLARSFGVFVDHVESFEIITADCVKRTVVKHSADVADQELFYAVLGGSPGNFGVVTHFTLRPHRDRDHPKSRGMKFIVPFTKDSFERLLTLLVSTSDDEDFPGDFDFTITVMSAFQEILHLWPGVDEQMRLHHPELYGADKDLPVLPFPAIVCFVQWANLGGAQQAYDPSFFERVKNAAGLIKVTMIKDGDHTPMSLLTRAWIYMNVREFELPYEKRQYITDSETLLTDRWPEWLGAQYAKVIFEPNGCKLVSQLHAFGGKHSQMRLHPDRELTSYSWRDRRINVSYDIFYEAKSLLRNPREIARTLHSESDVKMKGRNFATKDARWLWGSYGNMDMDVAWPHYYEDEAKYRRLCRTKRAVDEKGVFTPNAFCVGGGRTAKET